MRPQEKRSAYAPSTETPVRYDGIYRIAKCWRKPGAQGFLICRYLFVRCDNEPAPWSSEGVCTDDHWVLVQHECDVRYDRTRGVVCLAARADVTHVVWTAPMRHTKAPMATPPTMHHNPTF